MASMLAAHLGAPGSPLSILCLGAHADDIEIGCGATLLRLLAERPGSRVRWVVFSANETREPEARASAAAFLSGSPESVVEILHFRESFFPSVAPEIKTTFERLKGGPAPDLVLCHRPVDLHQDHRTIGELAWNTFRNHVIAEYEIPKYEGDLGQPNLFVPVPRAIAMKKIELITTHFPSQANRAWFRGETFEALMRVRGVECNAPEHFAEAFYTRKLVF
jgi:LmbE family N-acetylglucosaminyl deacetylase